MLRASFSEGSRPYDVAGFSLQHYARLLLDGYYLGVIGETLLLGLASAIISLVVGFPVGYSLARLAPAKRRLRLVIVILPLTLSLVVVVFGWLVVLGRNGMLNSIMMSFNLVERPQRLLFNRAAVLVVLIQQFLPFMILSVMSVVTQIDPVARTGLGQPARQPLYHVPQGDHPAGHAGHSGRLDPRLHPECVRLHHPADGGRRARADARQPHL